jgi:hypothetical protein
VGFQAMERILGNDGLAWQGWVYEAGCKIGCCRVSRHDGTYVCEPGPRVEGSWYVCVLDAPKRLEKRSFGTDFRGVAGAIVRRLRRVVLYVDSTVPNWRALSSMELNLQHGSWTQTLPNAGHQGF